MRIACLAIGTILGILLLIMMKKGSKYQEYIQALDGMFPLKALYTIGYGWNETKLLKLRGKNLETLAGQAKLLYEAQYSDFYATVIWVQTLTFSHIFVCFGMLLGGAMNFLFFALVGVACGGIFGYLFFTQLKEKLKTRQSNCLIELPEIVSTMALLINSGMPLRVAWSQIAESKKGDVYRLMLEANDDIRNGSSEADAIYKFGIFSNTPEIKKFASSLVQGLETDAKDLGRFLIEYSSEMWSLKKQIMLQKGEQAASKLLLPVSLIFLGVLVIVIAGAMGTLLQ